MYEKAGTKIIIKTELTIKFAVSTINLSLVNFNMRMIDPIQRKE